MSNYIFKIRVLGQRNMHETIYLHQPIDNIGICLRNLKSILFNRYQKLWVSDDTAKELTEYPVLLSWIDKDDEVITISSVDDLRVFLYLKQNLLWARIGTDVRDFYHTIISLYVPGREQLKNDAAILNINPTLHSKQLWNNDDEVTDLVPYMAKRNGITDVKKKNSDGATSNETSCNCKTQRETENSKFISHVSSTPIIEIESNLKSSQEPNAVMNAKPRIVPVPSSVLCEEKCLPDTLVEQTKNDSLSEFSALAKKLQDSLRGRIILHPNPRVHHALTKMISKGYECSDWLLCLLESVNGDVDKALEIMHIPKL